MIRYRRDAPAADQSSIDATVAHVRAHLSAVADADDDPRTHADNVVITIEPHSDDPELLSVTGVLDAEPDAPYLRSDFDPYRNVDSGTLRAAGLRS